LGGFLGTGIRFFFLFILTLLFFATDY
jgi:hypothetical protein